jgi:hypothetical protein
MTLIASNIKHEINKLFDSIKKHTLMDDYRSVTEDMWDSFLNTTNLQYVLHILDSVENILKNKQDEYIKNYLILNKLHPNVPESLVRYEYSYNYLNKPPVTGS